MKKTLAITFALTSAIAAANAQTSGLVSGYSFSGIVASSSATAVDADKSDFLPDAQVDSAVSSFSFFGDLAIFGQPGEVNLFGTGSEGVAFGTTQTTGLSTATDITSRPSSQDFLNNDGLLTITNLQGVVTAFEVAVDADGLGELGFENWSVDFAAGGDATIDWSISVDGGAFSSIGSTAISGDDNAYSLSFADAASDLILRGTFTDDFSPSESVTIDNFAVYGTTIVPEPSTYAAIAGALALGFVAYRRRK